MTLKIMIYHFESDNYLLLTKLGLDSIDYVLGSRPGEIVNCVNSKNHANLLINALFKEANLNEKHYLY